MITKEQEKEYVKIGGAECPICGHEDLDGDSSFNIGSGMVFQNIRCCSCGEEWTDEYTLTGITETEVTITKDELRYWDSGDEDFDRYTVVWPDGSFLGMSRYPFHPQGFGQHGESAEYEPDCTEKNDGLHSYLGKMIEFKYLPVDCKTLVLRDLGDN